MNEPTTMTTLLKWATLLRPSNRVIRSMEFEAYFSFWPIAMGGDCGTMGPRDEPEDDSGGIGDRGER